VSRAPLSLARGDRRFRLFDRWSYRPRVLPTPSRRAHCMATSADGTRIAWYRYGGGELAILFVPKWNIVDARVVGHQVAALEPHAAGVTYNPRQTPRRWRLRPAPRALPTFES